MPNVYFTEPLLPPREGYGIDLNRDENEEENFSPIQDCIEAVFSTPVNDDVEFKGILTKGMELKTEAERYSEINAARNILETSTTFKLKGALGLTLGGCFLGSIGYYGWKAHRGENKESTNDVETGIFSRNRVEKGMFSPDESVLFRSPEVASLVLDSSRECIDARHLNDISSQVVEKSFFQKLISDIIISVRSEKFYNKNIRPFIEDAINRTISTSKSADCVEKRFLLDNLRMDFRDILGCFEDGLMISSLGLCDLKKYYTATSRLLRDEFGDAAQFGKVFSPSPNVRNLSREALEVLNSTDVNSLRDEFTNALICLRNTKCKIVFSHDAECILQYARNIFREIRSLKKGSSFVGNHLQGIVIDNVANRLIHLHNKFTRQSNAEKLQLRNKFNYGLIKSILTRSDSDIEIDNAISYITLLVANATIIPDFLRLSKQKAPRLTDISVLTKVLLTMKEKRVGGEDEHLSNGPNAMPRISEKSIVVTKTVDSDDDVRMVKLCEEPTSFWSFLTSSEKHMIPCETDTGISQKDNRAVNAKAYNYTYTTNQDERCMTVTQKIKCQKQHERLKAKNDFYSQLNLNVGKISCLCPPPDGANVNIISPRQWFILPEESITVRTTTASKQQTIYSATSVMKEKSEIENASQPVASKLSRTIQEREFLPHVQEYNFTSPDNILLVKKTVGAEEDEPMFNLKSFDYDYLITKSSSVIIRNMLKNEISRDDYNRYFYKILKKIAEKFKSESRLEVENGEFLLEFKINISNLLNEIESRPYLRSCGLCDLYEKSLNILKYLYENGLKLAPKDQFYLKTGFKPNANVADIKLLGARARLILSEHDLYIMDKQLTDAYFDREGKKFRFSSDLNIILKHVKKIFLEAYFLDPNDLFQKMILENVSIKLSSLNKIGHVSRYGNLIYPLLTTDDIMLILDGLNDESDFDSGFNRIILIIALKMVLPDFSNLKRDDSYNNMSPVILNDILDEIQNRRHHKIKIFNDLINLHFCSPGNCTIAIKQNINSEFTISPTTNMVTDESPRYADTGFLIVGHLMVSVSSVSIVGIMMNELAPIDIIGVDVEFNTDDESSISDSSIEHRDESIEHRDEDNNSGYCFSYPDIDSQLKRVYSLVDKDKDPTGIQHAISEIKTVFRGGGYFISVGLNNNDKDSPLVKIEKDAVFAGICQLENKLSTLNSLFYDISKGGAHASPFKRDLINYFSSLMNTRDNDVIFNMILRFKEVVLKNQNTLHLIAENNYNNIWFATSASGDISLDCGTLLSPEHINEMPFAAAYIGKKSIITVYPEKKIAIKTPGCIGDGRSASHSLEETLNHELTHISSVTQDYMYFSRYNDGRIKSSKEMLDEFHNNLRLNDISEEMKSTIRSYCRLCEKPYPENLYDFFQKEILFKSYILMNNAPCHEVFFREIYALGTRQIDVASNSGPGFFIGPQLRYHLPKFNSSSSSPSGSNVNSTVSRRCVKS
ncbi:hypothetical protein ACQUFY_24910 (plasmid) [Robbsia andropogonis]|uniref:hypothetical protein n=1 Tax=Robbsia andropogonis TaxID=28092 RepID=UPI003D1AA92E